ncbi:MAG: hypothetical protein V4667_00755 [Bacteroidota bacterium]
MKKNREIFAFILVLIFILIIVFVSKAWIESKFPGLAERGQFGDMFGFVNALFSGFGFLGLLTTIYLQRQELKIQQIELKETKEIFIQQNKLMITQQNISMFFSLIENHRVLVINLSETLNIDSQKRTLFGNELINYKTEWLFKYLDEIKWLLKKGKGNARLFNEKHPDYILFNNSNYYVFESIRVIITFVIEHLENDELYHKILYNSLTKNEKILAGIYLEYNGLSSKHDAKILTFNFKEEFILNQKNFKFEFTKIPKLYFHFPYHSVKNVLNYEKQENEIIFKNLTDSAVLKSIRYDYIDNKDNLFTNKKTLNLKLEKDEDYRFNQNEILALHKFDENIKRFFEEPNDELSRKEIANIEHHIKTHQLFFEIEYLSQTFEVEAKISMNVNVFKKNKELIFSIN